MLTAMARTCDQVRAGLARRGFAEETIDGLVARLSAVGLLDDLAYAQAVVRARRDMTGSSRRAIGAELKRKGVPDDVVGQALSEYPCEDEGEVALEEARRQVFRRHGQPRERVQRQVFAALARKGYGPTVAHDAVSAVLREVDHDVARG